MDEKFDPERFLNESRERVAQSLEKGQSLLMNEQKDETDTHTHAFEYEHLDMLVYSDTGVTYEVTGRLYDVDLGAYIYELTRFDEVLGVSVHTQRASWVHDKMEVVDDE